jgi:hypothetical protein
MVEVLAAGERAAAGSSVTLVNAGLFRETVFPNPEVAEPCCACAITGC